MKSKLYLICLMFYITSCELPDFDGPIELDFEYLGPVIKSKTTLENLAELENIEFKHELRNNDIGQAEGTVPLVPPIGPLPPIGPTEFVISEHFVSIHAEILDFNIEIHNHFPIDIQEGTELAFYNQSDGETILRHTISQSIPPDSTYNFDVLLEDIFLDANLDFYIENFQSNGSEDPVTFSAEDGADFIFTLKFLQLNNIIVRRDQSYTVEDTVSADLLSEDDYDDAAKGVLTVYFENAFPFEMDVQVYFQRNENGNSTNLDSLFNTGPVRLESAQLNPHTGQLISDFKSMDSIFVDADWIRNIRECNAVYTYFSVSTEHLTDDTKILATESFIDIQIVSDLDLSIRIE